MSKYYSRTHFDFDEWLNCYHEQADCLVIVMVCQINQHGISSSNETIRCFTTLHNLKLYLGFIAQALFESL
jgi:hypothetical protein